MGCDIHLYVEKRVNGAWKAQGDFEREVEDGESYLVGGKGYSDRNYNLFAILADVRNGRGFAGIKTGEGFNPISHPRGLPDDVTAEVKEISDRWDCDGHSHSYFTLRDLLDYDWTQTTGLQGWCNMEEFLPWAACGNKFKSPRGYCGGVSGGAVVHLTDEEAATLVEHFRELNWNKRNEFIKQHSGKYALAKWQEYYHQASGSFWTYFIPELLTLAGGTAGMDDVRIVFFFDN